MFRELIQLAVSVKRYISSPENALEMIMIGLVLWIITQNTEENVSFVPIYWFPLVGADLRFSGFAESPPRCDRPCSLLGRDDHLDRFKHKTYEILQNHVIAFKLFNE